MWGRSLARYDTERAKLLMEQESEMLGTMFGDGAMSRVDGSIQIAITGDEVDDKDYLFGHVRPPFAKLFGINLKTRYRLDEKLRPKTEEFKNSSATLIEYARRSVKKMGFHPTSIQLNDSRSVRTTPSGIKTGSRRQTTGLRTRFENEEVLELS